MSGLLPLAPGFVQPADSCSGPPLTERKGRIGRDAALCALMDLTVNRAIRRLHNEVRRAVGLPATSELGKDPALAQQLVLCQGMPELEPARPDLPEHLHHIGDAAASTRKVEPTRGGWSSSTGAARLCPCPRVRSDVVTTRWSPAHSPGTRSARAGWRLL